jgi:NADH:ubiquinone reductase (non-electrogenic)
MRFRFIYRTLSAFAPPAVLLSFVAPSTSADQERAFSPATTPSTPAHTAPPPQPHHTPHPNHTPLVVKKHLEPSVPITALTPYTVPPPPGGKKHVVVVGTGWASISFLRNLTPDPNTQVTVVSPRGVFLYTPLLPAAAVGSVEARSIVEPVRSLLPEGAVFIEAAATSIDPVSKTLLCTSALDAGRPFILSYDILVLAPGSVANDMGTPGVKEYARMLRSYDDVVGLRKAVHEAWEKAALPTTSDEEAKRLLTFVLCGGGPTGSELAAELRDLFTNDLAPMHPRLAPLASVIIIDSNSHVLSMFDKAIAEYATRSFSNRGIELILKSRVTAVTKDGVTVLDKATNKKREIQAATVVWATGVGLHPLASSLARALPSGSQTNTRALVVDDRLRVKGSGGSIYAFGDAATIEPDFTAAHATQLFTEFDADKNGTLDVGEVSLLLARASRRHPALREHSRLFVEAKEMLDAGTLGVKFESPVESSGLSGFLSLLTTASSPATAEVVSAKTALRDALMRVHGGEVLTLDEFLKLITSMDQHLRALPATAQVARQQGFYLSQVANRGELGRTSGAHLATPPFVWSDLGSFAFIGNNEAVAKLPGFGVVQGVAAGLAWRGFETSQQQGMRSKMAVASDQIRSSLFGRGL